MLTKQLFENVLNWQFSVVLVENGARSTFKYTREVLNNKYNQKLPQGVKLLVLLVIIKLCA